MSLVKQQLDDQKAREIETLDLTDVAQFADAMIVASGTSTRHVAALARGLQEKIKAELNINAIGVEGVEASDWILVDFGDVIVHIMLPASRSFYEIEKLWSVRPEQSQAKLAASSNDSDNNTDTADDNQNYPTLEPESSRNSVEAHSSLNS